MENLLLWVQAAAGKVRRETFRGKEHLVAPVIMVQEGVLKGAFASEEELSTHVQGWNGMPVTLKHPNVRGEDVSARDPQILEEYATGLVFNTQWDSVKKQLKAEAWIDAERLASMGEAGAAALAAIENEDPIDVSTGFFAPIVNRSGSFKGKRYFGAFSSIRPDHLALLPGTKGECSWEDGCGVRSNSSDDTKNRSDSMDKKKLVETLITNEGTDFTKDDEETLMAMDESILRKFAKRAGCKCEDIDDVNANANAKDDVNANANANAKDDEKKDDVVTLSADDVKKMIADGVAAALSEKDPERIALMSALKADESIDLKDEDFESMTTNQLRAFASAAQCEVDYSGRGISAPITTNRKDAPAAPPSILLAPASKSEQ